MQNNRGLEEKFAKTTALFGGVELVSSIAFLCDSKLGLLVGLCANAYLIYQLHEFGKQRRAGSNMMNSAYSFFAARAQVPTHDAENAFRNIINGGGYVFDEIARLFDPTDEARHRLR